VPTLFFALSPRHADHVATTHRSFRPEQTDAFSFLIRSCE